jgi:indolepyruvate ferredoxin oxidoreductase beta subunit
MEPINIILSGLGGQGILFMTGLLARAALEKGFSVLGAETHGMAQRGGSVISHLRIGRARSSLVRAGRAHFLLSLDEVEAYRNLSYLGFGSTCYVDAPDSPSLFSGLDRFLRKRGIVFRFFPARRVALEMGAPRAANLALLGYFAGFEKEPVGYGELRTAMEVLFQGPSRERSLQIFEAGYEGALRSRNKI